MADDLKGKRMRYAHERKAAQANAGKPLKKDVSLEARERLVRESDTRAYVFSAHTVGDVPFLANILAKFHTITGIDMHTLPFAQVQAMSSDVFSTFLEIAMEQLWEFRDPRRRIEDFDALQSILADDASALRFRVTEDRDGVHFAIDEIDNPHLDREIVDRTFELTTNVNFASAQKDYASAWENYARGEFDKALVDAQKAFESAAKKIIKLVDPKSSPEQMQTSELVPPLRDLEIIPSKLGNMVGPLMQVFQNSGALRNAPGAAHGSIDLTSPEANVALLGLHLAGSLVFYLAQRWESLKPS